MKRSIVIDLTESPSPPSDSNIKVGGKRNKVHSVEETYQTIDLSSSGNDTNSKLSHDDIDMNSTQSFSNSVKKKEKSDSTSQNYVVSLLESPTKVPSAQEDNDGFACDISNSSLELEGDNADVITGIMELVQELKINNLATTFGFLHLSITNKNMQGMNALPSSVTRSFQPYHIMQKDKWSCGYRNTQMVLSSLIPILSSDHSFFSVHSFLTHNHLVKRTIPSLRQLQIYLESCWQQGFDPKGAKHYNYRILGKTSFIGAVEVHSVLSYLHIDSAVVQFIQCPESRSKLGPFVWSYFAKQGKNPSCNFCSKFHSSNDVKPCSSSTHASRLLDMTDRDDLSQQPSKTEPLEEPSCDHPLLPLYLQWDGHSVTIVGIEKTFNTQGKITFDLLILDPMKNGLDIKDSLSLHVAKLQSMGKNSKESPSDKNDHRPSNRIKCLSKMRLATSKLLKKDCQIVLCSTRQLPHAEREKFKIIVNALTAAEHDVNLSLRKGVPFA